MKRKEETRAAYRQIQTWREDLSVEKCEHINNITDRMILIDLAKKDDLMTFSAAYAQIEAWREELKDDDVNRITDKMVLFDLAIKQVVKDKN